MDGVGRACSDVLQFIAGQPDVNGALDDGHRGRHSPTVAHGRFHLGWLPAALVPNLQSPRSSRVVVGQDVRAEMSSTAASHHLYHTSYFFEMRRQLFLPLAPYLQKQALTEKEARYVLGSLKYIKYVPEAACAALDLWPGEIDAVPRLGQELDIDMGIVARVEALRTQESPLADLAAVQATLRQAMLFVEQVHDALVARRQEGAG